MTAKLRKINSASATVRYFEKDSGIAPSSAAQYYAGKDFEHRAASAWFGSGARMLKLKGPVDPDAFQSVLSGKVPGTSIELGRKVVVDEETGKTRLEHNPGDDLTFSAPKSVSLAALYFQEDKALDAHDRAVARTLLYIQEHCIQTRRNQNRENSGAMVGATFRHDTSRNHDPQLHTHAIIANMTRRGDGKWTSIDRGSVSLYQRVIEAYYHNELAKNLMEEGYRLRPVQHGGTRIFEIEGYTDEVLAAFSTRRRDILKDLSDKGIRYSASAAQRAALRTRRAKEAIPREELHRHWDETAAKLDFENPSSEKERRRTRKDMRQNAKNGVRDPLGRDIDSDLHKTIATTLEHLGYHTPVIADTAIKATVMGHLAGRVTLERIEGALVQLEKDGHLHRSKKPGSRGAWVTQEALLAENRVVRHMRKWRGQARPIRPGFDPERLLAGSGLTPGQSNAIDSILNSTDRVSAVQGYAGTGKTTMLRTLVKHSAGMKYAGLAPTVGASVLLGKEAGIPSGTLQGFLTRHKDIAGADDYTLREWRGEYRDTVLVVDEASMIGTRQMEELFKITEQLEIERLVLVGDKRQLRSIEAGQPFTQLQQKGMETAVMDDIVRQKHEGLKVPVEMLLAGNVSCALERLNDEDNKTGRVVEVEREGLHETAARLYLGLGMADRPGTTVMATTNHDREEINAHIREGLQEEGLLGGMEYEGIRLANRHLTPTEKADAINYEPGDILVFHSKYRSEDGEDHFRVKEVGKDGRLLVETESGHWRHFDPGKGKMAHRYEVFEEREITLLENDRVRFTRNDPDHRDSGVVNGAEATVEKIGSKSVTLRLATDDPGKTGDVVKLDRDHNALKHLDHGYCRTTFSAQGQTCDRVIAVADSSLGHVADQKNFYVQISRAREEAVVVTDDIVELGDNLERHTGEVMSAMEAVSPPDQETEREEEIRWEHDRDIEMPERRAKVGLPSEGESVTEFGHPRQFPQHFAAMMARTADELGIEPAAVITDGQEVGKDEIKQTHRPDGMEDEPTVPDDEVAPDRPLETRSRTDIVLEGDPATEQPTPPTEEPEADQTLEQVDGRNPDMPDPDDSQPEDSDASEDTDQADTVEPGPPPEWEPYFGEIGTGVIEVPQEELNALAAGAWLSLPAEVKDRTGIFATPERQQDIEGMIRKSLYKSGRVNGYGTVVKRLIIPPLTDVEKKDARFYKEGDLLYFAEDNPSQDIRAKQRIPVLGPGNDNYNAKIKVPNRGRWPEPRERELDLHELTNFTIFRPVPMELQAGDQVRLRRGDDELGIKAQSRAVVREVDTRRESVHLRLADGSERELSKYNRIFEGCDYDFNVSRWEFQQNAVENIIAVTDGLRPSLGVVGDIRPEIDRMAKNAVLLTNNLININGILGKHGEESLDLAKGINGLIRNPEGYIAKALEAIEQKRKAELEQRRGEGRGMRM